MANPVNNFNGIGKINHLKHDITPTGISVSTFILDINTRPKKHDYLSCKAWRAVSDKMKHDLKDNDIIAISGYIEITKWNNTRYVHVVVEEFKKTENIEA
jgi:hypothetical protein